MSDATIEVEATAPEVGGFGERWNDRLNPILVKEVRQALRGRYFKVSFWATLTVATLVGLGMMVALGMEELSGIDGGGGMAFFLSIFTPLVCAVQVLVPFSAFLSMGGEWDENTYDLLVLSNLKPRQIVLGKILSAGVQSLLFYSAFGPFLVFAFLLRGIDLGALLVVLVFSMAGSLLLSCLAVAMSSFSRARFARVVLMGLLAVALVWGGFGMVAGAAQLILFPGTLHDPEFLEIVGAWLTITLAVTAFFFAAACARLAHPEENRSTGLRVIALVIVACGLGWMTWYLGTSPKVEPILVAVCLAHTVLAVTALFFVTEPERLGRRVAAGVPRSQLLLALQSPFLPGGARGLLFYLVGSVLVALWAYGYPLAFGKLGFDVGELALPLVLTGYGLVFLGLPSAPFGWHTGSILVRTIARIVILVFFVASILLPALIGFFLHIDDWTEFEHPGNVFLVVDDIWRDRWRIAGVVPTLVVMSIVTLVLNAPRLVKAFGETDRARKARLARE